MTAEIITLPVVRIERDAEQVLRGDLSKAEASALIDASPFLKQLEKHVADLYGVDPASVREGLLRNHRDPGPTYDPKKPLEIDETAVRALVEEDSGRA